MRTDPLTPAVFRATYNACMRGGGSPRHVLGNGQTLNDLLGVSWFEATEAYWVTPDGITLCEEWESA